MTLAQELEKQNRLAASFFFDKRVTQNGASFLTKFITTLARQISRFDPKYHHALVKALKSNPDIVNDRLELQARQLLIDPLSAAYAGHAASPSNPNAVLVFDALDECGSPADLDVVLHILAILDSLPANYRVFFTSRPHPAISRELPLHATGQVETLDDLKYQTSASQDILRFTETQFRDGKPADLAGSTWPPAVEEVKHLSELCHGLFELAALRIRRVKSAPSKGLSLRRVFDVVVNEARGQPVGRLEDELEAEYLRILEWAYPSKDRDLHLTIETYRLIVGAFVSLRNPLSLDAMSRLLDMSENDVRTALRPLSSVFFVDIDSAAPIRCYHATFREFLLTTPSCSTTFHRSFLFDAPQHSMMVRICVERLSRELRTDMCPETLDYDTLADIPDFENKISAALPQHLRYCCLYWEYHLILTQSEESDMVQELIGNWIMSGLLKWIEALALLKEVNEAISILWRTAQWYRSQASNDS